MPQPKSQANAQTKAHAKAGGRKSGTTKRKGEGAKAQAKSSADAVTRNVVAARDKIVEGVTGSLNAVLLTRKNIEDVIDDAVKRGRITPRDAQDVIHSLLQRGARATGEIISDIDRIVGRSGDVEQAAGSGGLPIAGYDNLSAAQVTEQLPGLTPAELRKVRDYERRNANRKTVLDPVERRLG